MRHIDTIMIHCSATYPDWMDGAGLENQKDEIEKWHVIDREWLGIAYAELFGREGDTAMGRDLNKDGSPWDDIGAGAKGHNAHTIHLCLIGGAGASANDAFDDHYTEMQDVALRKVIARLCTQFGTIKHIIGHNEVANKACPGFQVGPWLNRKKPRTKLGSKTLQASTTQLVAGSGTVISAVSTLDGTAQYVLIGLGVVIIAAAAWIARERIKKWARGIQ
jgi:hypothetical protein